MFTSRFFLKESLIHETSYFADCCDSLIFKIPQKLIKVSHPMHKNFSFKFLYIFKMYIFFILSIDSASQDELLWSATWLYRATNDEYYLKYVVDNCVSLGGTGWAVKEFSWDNKYAGVQILLSKVF